MDQDDEERFVDGVSGTDRLCEARTCPEVPEPESTIVCRSALAPVIPPACRTRIRSFQRAPRISGRCGSEPRRGGVPVSPSHRLPGRRPDENAVAPGKPESAEHFRAGNEALPFHPPAPPCGAHRPP